MTDVVAIITSTRVPAAIPSPKYNPFTPEESNNTGSSKYLCIMELNYDDFQSFEFISGVTRFICSLSLNLTLKSSANLTHGVYTFFLSSFQLSMFSRKKHLEKDI